MIVPLRDVTCLKSGVFAKPDTNASLYFVQGNDFDSHKKWKSNLKPVLEITESLKKHILKKEDVLFLSKGREFFAVKYDGRYSPAVASSAFLVLKVSERILPDFLVWFLNHPKTNSLLNQLSSGSALPMLSKSALGEIEIPLLSLEDQQKIITIDKLKKREEALQQKIQALKDNCFNELTYTILQKN